MCFFVLFFIIVAFKVLFYAFFLGKNVLFFIEPPIFSGKHHYSEGFEHKKVNFFKVFFPVLIFWKKILGLTSLGIKFTPIYIYYPYVPLDMMKI